MKTFWRKHVNNSAQNVLMPPRTAFNEIHMLKKKKKSVYFKYFLGKEDKNSSIISMLP